MVPQSEAAKSGYSQNLWVWGEDDALTEVGTMNMFVALRLEDGTVELITPPLDDMILPGVTRDSYVSILLHHNVTHSSFFLVRYDSRLMDVGS